MKTITTPTGIELILVSVPEDAEYFEVLELIKKELKSIKNFPRQGWKILGSVTKDTIDFDCSSLVDSYSTMWSEVSRDATKTEKIKRYMNYMAGSKARPTDYDFNNPADSFRSLLQSTGVTFENQYGEEPLMVIPDGQSKIKFDPLMINNPKWEQWEAAEKNVVKKVAIIQKMKP